MNDCLTLVLGRPVTKKDIMETQEERHFNLWEKKICWKLEKEMLTSWKTYKNAHE